MTDTPRRIQLSRAKGWRMPPNTTSVARPTQWGNPFRVVECGRSATDGSPRYAGRHDWEMNYPSHATRREAAERAVSCFREKFTAGLLTRCCLGDLHILRGRNLACWCPLDQPCHADVLLELANPTTPTAEPTP